MKNKLKVDVVTKYFCPVTAGIETNIRETYCHFIEENWSLTVHTSQNTLLDKNCLPRKCRIKGLKVRRYPFGLFGFIPNIDWRQTDFLCLHNFNVFPHFQLMLFTLFLKIINRKNYSLIITPHGGFNPEWSVFPPLVAFLKRIYHFTLGVLLINLSADGVRAVSEWEKQEMVKKHLNPKLIEVIDNGIEDEAFADLENQASQQIKNQVKEFGKYIIQIGRIYPIKNYETAIKALVSTPSDLSYVIAGPISDRNYYDSLIQLITDLGLEKRVIFVGVVNGIDKFYLIKHAQMMVHMALWESFCNVVHEGLSQGLVCLVADNTALPFLIDDNINGFLIDTKDHQALGQKINYVLSNKNSPHVLAMQRRNIIYGRKNSWRQVSARMRDFYQKTREKIIGSTIEDIHVSSAKIK
ncbi:MAG: glycosyltransferase family 4 protein [Patescibacteria group bacterium]|jgi:glycosyltransferase involved in cell wall biosynthesis